MMDLTVTHKITQGMYVLTTEGGGCVVDAVSQVSGGDSPLFSVAVMKKNRTNELMRENSKFALSVLGVQGAGELIKQFGFQSSRDVNKFEGVAVTEVEGSIDCPEYCRAGYFLLYETIYGEFTAAFPD